MNNRDDYSEFTPVKPANDPYAEFTPAPSTLRSTVYSAVSGSPDAAASAFRLGKQTGLPMSLVERNMEEVRKRAATEEIDRVTQGAPVLRAQFEKPEFAAVAHDDVQQLGLFETLANSFRRGIPGLQQNLAGTALRSNANTLQQVDSAQALLDAGKTGLTLQQDPHGLEYMTADQRAAFRAQASAAATANAVGIATNQAEKARFPAPAVTGEVMAAKTFGEAFTAFAKAPLQFIASIGPESLVSNAPALVAGALVPGGAAVKATIAGVGSGTVDYGSQIVEGLTRAGVNLADPKAVEAAARDPKIMKQIASEAMRHAGVVGLVDGLSGGVASRLALPGKMLAKAPVARELANLAAQTPVQGVLGGIGEAGGELAAGQPLDPGNILAEIVGEAFSAPAEVASIAGGRVRERMAQASEAKAHAAQITALADAAKQSKLRTRDAATFADMASKMTDGAEVFIDAKTFAQSMKPEQLDALPESITSQLPEALQTGSDIAIPVADYAAHLAEVPGLVEHLRASPDAMTQAEAEAYKPDEDLRAEVDRIAPPEAAPTPQAEALAQARQSIVDQLTAANRFTPQVNEQYVDLIDAYLTTTAERAGLDVEGIRAMVPRIVSQLGLGPTLDQPGVSSNASKQADGRPIQDSSGVRAGLEPVGVRGPATDRQPAAQADGRSVQVDRGVRGGPGLLAEPGRPSAGPARREADGSLAGLPRRVGDYVASVFPRSEEVAQRYVAARGQTYTPPATYAKVDTSRAKRIADAFEAMPHDPSDPKVRAAYDAMISETIAQYRAILATGLKVEFITGADPYAGNPRAMIDDVRNNNHMWVYGTRDGFGSNVEFDPIDNPLLAETAHEISGRPALANDLFRVVHDYFGHVKEGVGFRADGEENAWRAHAAMYSPEARRAMTTETRGQNSWVNFGPHGDANRTAAAASTVYADQKIGLLPEWVSTEGAGDDVLHQGQRGAFDPSTKTIALLEHADLSTFLHESGHAFLDGYATQATRADAPAGIKADMQTVLDSFGVKDIETWNGMSLEQQREHHEAFARGFEAYLMEGTAPSVELASMFGRFRSWLLSVYKRLAPGSVTPEVRGVMDRMLATDAQIAEKAERPMFGSAEVAGMTPEQFAAYQATGEAATEQAVGELQGRSLRDLAFIANSKRREVSKLNAEARAKRAAIETEVTAEVHAVPIVAAYIDLTRGHTADGQPVRLSRADVEASHPGLVDRIPQSALANSERALPADMVAEAYGLTSGDELVKLLATMDNPKTIIEARVDQRMLERHGELTDDRSIERAAHAAIANDARARVLTTESNTLAKAVGNKPLIERAARAFAAASVAARKVRELRPAQFRAAEARAGRVAADAFKKGDIAGAAQAKRTQVLQHVMARATSAAVLEVGKAIDYLSKFDSATTRKAIGPEYSDQIDQLLERFDLRKSPSLKSIDKRKSLASWVESQQALGFEPVLDEKLLAESKLTSYKDMTVEELRGLVDTVKNIEHLGRLKERLLTARDDRNFAEVVGAVSAGIVEHGGSVRPVELEGERGVKFWLQGALASTRKIASLAYRFDGAKDAGPVFDNLIRPMNEAGTREAVAIEQATIALGKLYAPIEALKGGTNGAKVFIAEIGASLSRGGRLSVALNLGNEGNRQRLMDGDHWTADQVNAIVRTLSPVELQFVNDVHAYIDSFWPQIKAQQLRVSGVVEDKVAATPWTATASDGTQVQMRGGYYPAKYDTARSAKAEAHDAAQVAKDMLSGAYVRATTRRGHTKERSEQVKDRPLRKDLGVITSHVTEVIHNLAWQEWLIDANRLMGAKAIDGAMRSHYGPAVIRTIKDDIAGIATGDAASSTDLEKGMLWLRSNMTRATLGASFTTAIMQPFGLSNSVARIGAKPVLRGLLRWGGDATRMESSMTWVAEKSDFMRLRSKQFNRELNEIAGRVDGKSKTMQTIDAALMFMTTKAQQIVDIPTWVGRYEQAIDQGHDEASAIAQADEAVISSQGSGQTKDLAEVQRKHKMLTSFFSYFSTTANLIAVKTATTEFKSPKAVAGWIGDMALLAVIPAIAPAVLKSLLQGGGGDDGDGWAKFLAKQEAGYLLSMLPLVREASGFVQGFSYTGPPVARVLTDGFKLTQQVRQGEVDEPAVMALGRFFGDLTGAPMTQIMRSYKGWHEWAHGHAPATSVLMGPPQKGH